MRSYTSTVGTVLKTCLARRAPTVAGTAGGQRAVQSLVFADVRNVRPHSTLNHHASEDRPNVFQYGAMRHEKAASFAADGHAGATGAAHKSASYGHPASDRPELTVVNMSAEDDGMSVKVEFADAFVFKFRSSWLRDSSPDLASESFIRANASDVLMTAKVYVTNVWPLDGSFLRITFSDGVALTYRGDWLRAFAPFAAEQVRVPFAARSTGLQLQKAHLMDELWHNKRQLWESDFECVNVDAKSLMDSSSAASAQKKLVFETLCCDGAIVIRNMEKPSSFAQSQAGEPMQHVAKALAGKLYQHPIRNTNYGIMRREQVTADIKHLTDYNLEVQLAMHNDHAFISDANAGYWQLLHQVNGAAKAKLVNAAAVAAELQRIDPDAYQLLTEIHVTHALRTLHYDMSGNYTGDLGRDHDGVFEDESTHPILSLGTAATREVYLEKVSHQEIKRGVCAVAYDKQDAFLDAYRKWIELTESERFVAYVDWPEDSMLVVNNSWVLHGRGIPQSKEERVMVWGYMQKHIVDLSYRLLMQRELLSVHGVPGRFSSRIPNQVLAELIRLYSLQGN